MRAENSTRGTVLGTSIDIADTSEKKRIGLLNRESIKPGQGMWLMGTSNIHTFGMKFPIDVLFLDKQGAVLGILPELSPNDTSGRYPYCKVDSVLELPAGMCELTGTKIGDLLELTMPVTNVGETFARTMSVLSMAAVCMIFALLVAQ